jgi:hypothetical protein
MTEAVHHSLSIPTDIIEHALLHARQETLRCHRCEEAGDIGVAELQLAMESRLMNARALINAVYDKRKRNAPMRSMMTVDYLIREAIELCMLSHWMNKNFESTEVTDGA